MIQGFLCLGLLLLACKVLSGWEGGERGGERRSWRLFSLGGFEGGGAWVYRGEGGN